MPVDPDALTGCADDQKYSRAEVDAMREVLNPTALPPEMEERNAHQLLAAIANKHRNSDLRMDHPDVKALVDGPLDTIRTLQADIESRKLGLQDALKCWRDELATEVRNAKWEADRAQSATEHRDAAMAELSRLRADLEAANTRITDRQTVIDQHNQTIEGLEAAMVERWEKNKALEAENAGLRKDKEKEC